jgi:hypothetical protein
MNIWQSTYLAYPRRSGDVIRRRIRETVRKQSVAARNIPLPSLSESGRCSDVLQAKPGHVAACGRANSRGKRRDCISRSWPEGAGMTSPPVITPQARNLSGRRTGRIVAGVKEKAQLLLDRDQAAGPNASPGLVCLVAWLVAFWSLIAAQAGPIIAVLSGLVAAAGALAAMCYLVRPHGGSR